MSRWVIEEIEPGVFDLTRDGHGVLSRASLDAVRRRVLKRRSKGDRIWRVEPDGYRVEITRRGL